MKVAITGAAGYVGSLLVRAHVARGDSVFATARDAAAIPALPGIARYAADITASHTLPEAFFEGADVLYHCAAEIAREPLMQAVNVDATRELVRRARGGVAHWVQVSSLAVYGTPRAGVVDERTRVSARSAYARSKLEAERLVEGEADAFSHTIVRPSAVIGPGVRTRSIHALIDAVAKKRFCFIGRPGAIGNYVHEDNLVSALLLCAMQPAARGRAYIVSQNCTMESMIAAISTELDVARPPLRLPQAPARLAAQLGRLLPAFPLTPARVDALTSRVEYRSDAIERELGFRHAKSIEEGVRELARAWKAGAR